jgi:hypothetical protein
MPTRSFMATWVLSFAGCFSLAVISYGLAQSGSPLRIYFSYVLLPGVGLYTLLNGSLLFGSGFGAVGNFLIVGLGSAVVWSLAVAVLVGKWVRFF